MIDADDVQLQIKKKARRRLVGAVAFAALAALVLPMVMDQEPAPPAQEVEIRIPGQDGKPFQPTTAALPPVEAAPAPEPTPSAPAAAPVPVPAQPAPAVVQEKPVPSQPVARVIDKTPTQADSKPDVKPVKPEAKPEPKPKLEPKPEPKSKVESKVEPKPEAKPVKADTGEAQRAAAILAGKPSETSGGSGSHVILIGAFANEANVKNIKAKLGELGVKVYTEPLESPQGKKIRVRAGPFPSRDAADKALEKMKRIGVSGVVTSK